MDGCRSHPIESRSRVMASCASIRFCQRSSCRSIKGSGTPSPGVPVMPMSEYVYRRRVQFKETDASGLAHFSMFFAYAEEAEHAMWRAVGLSVEARDSDIGWPRVSASFDFFKALRF